MKIQPVILAGGNGYRLWPLSQKTRPKQFLKYDNNLSSFQSTIIRNNYLGEPLVIANINHHEIVIEQLKEINSPCKIIFEPAQKNTAICAITAAYFAKKQGFDTIILLPSDHYIDDQINYRYTLEVAANVTKQYKFSTIGVTPTYPNSNFGYIKIASQLGEDTYLATQFIEKPNKESAKKLITSPEYFWNSGIYLFDIDYTLALAKQYIPLVNGILSKVNNYDLWENNVIKLNKEMYSRLPSISFDNAISENLKKMALVKAGFKWSDLGTWESMWNLETPNDYQNCIQGQGVIVTHNVKDSYINSDAKETIVIDLENIAIIFKNGQLLVADKNSTEFIKRVVVDHG